MPMDGDTSEESKAPSWFAMALPNDAIKSRARGSSQKGMTPVEALVGTDVAICVSRGTGVNDGGAVNVGWGVADGRAVGSGAVSTGMAQLARVIKIRTENILNFIFDSL